MFQVAALAAYARRHKLIWAVPPRYPTAIYDFNMPVVDPYEAVTIWFDPGFNYTEIPACSPGARLQLRGFYQSHRYFSDCQDYVRDELLRLEPVPVNNSVSIHVRRTDFQGHGTCFRFLPQHYYQQAVRLFTERGKFDFTIFSDDLPWCQSVFPVICPQARFTFCEESHPRRAMALMAACDGHIIANSTFSWWAAWLHKDAVVLCPHRRDWFGEHYADANMDDLYPAEWLQLPAGDTRV